MDKRILHISCDDQFLNYAVEQFDSISNVQSDFVMVDYSPIPSHLKRVDRVQYYQATSENLEYIISSFPIYSAIIFHGLLGGWSHYLLSKVHDSMKVAWVCWGSEVWGINEKQYYAPITKAIWTLKGVKDKIIYNKSADTNSVLSIDLLNRIDYCLTDMAYECDAANRLFGTSMQWLPYNYYSIERTIGELKEDRCEGHNVFIGNSAYWGNNLVECLWLVYNYRGDIIVPLNNGSKACAKVINQLGKVILNSRFIPIMKYLPRNEYNCLIKQCCYMIQYQFHPQAQGNIITGLWLGQKVFLSKKNPTFRYFKSLGVHIYSVEDDLQTELQHPSILSESELDDTRNALLNSYSFEAMRKNVIKIVSTIA